MTSKLVNKWLALKDYARFIVQRLNNAGVFVMFSTQIFLVFVVINALIIF